MYCIVDLETTGGSATKSRLTEIAIYKTDGKKIIEEFSSLINPGRNIPQHISRLTGITDQMVEGAPPFSQLIDKIDQFTQDSIFVAHNVNFDYNFLRAEFERCGKTFKRKKLCTVRLSRQIIKGKSSYSLGKLCNSIGIPLENRHRAAGDAKATTLLFHKLLREDKENVIKNSLKVSSLEALLPPNLSKSEFLALPESQGIYYFKDLRKKIVYIGQAKNIKQRVHSHFSGNSNSKSKYYFSQNIHGLDFKLIPNDLLLDLIEAVEIKKHWPRHNRSLKRVTLNHAIFQYTDQKSYLRLGIGRCGKFEKPLKTFKSREEAFQTIRSMLIDYELCPRLCGLQPLGSGKCNYIEDFNCKGACCDKENATEYNKRLKIAVSEQIEKESTYLLEEKKNDQRAIVLVEKGRVKGFGVIDNSIQIKNIEEAKSMLSATYDDQDLSQILQRQLNKPSKHQEITYF